MNFSQANKYTLLGAGMDLSRLIWLKNVKPQLDDHDWAYKHEDMAIQEAKIFRLAWRSREDRKNAQAPDEGDLMLLLQRARVTHIVKFLDAEVYESSQSEWGIHRIVKAIWMPPDGLNWSDERLHQRELFRFDYIVGDGSAHSLREENRMPQFHEHWDLPTFQQHVANYLTHTKAG